MNINAIDYNYKFLKLKFGNVNDAIFELSSKVPHICYPLEIQS